MEFLSLNCPFSQFFLQILILIRSECNFLADFISIEDISMLYIRDSDFTNVQTKIEAKIWIFFFLMGFLYLNCQFS